MPHPFYERLLDIYCEESGFRADDIRAMVEGRKRIKAVMIELFAKELGVPPEAWTKPSEDDVTSAYIEYAEAHGGDSEMTPAQLRALKDNGKRRRRFPSRVHQVLDLLDWTLSDLAIRLPAELGRPISKSSLQFFATGSRPIKTGKDKESIATPVCAPLDVREAAQRVTAREAANRRLGVRAILPAGAWPNVGLPGIKQRERLNQPPYERQIAALTSGGGGE